MPEDQIASLRLTPERPRPGESVLVEALDADGQLVQNTEVAINGVRGARQHLQFESAGQYEVQAVAGPAGAVTSGSAAVTVASDAVVAGALPDRFPVLEARHAATARTPYSVAFNATDTDAFTVSLAQAFQTDGADQAGLTAASTVTSWTWDFGTGETVQTTTPEVEYDFESHLAVDQEHQLFDVTCELALADGSTSTVTRTLSVVNAYAVCRARGVLAPPVTAVSPAKKVLKAFQASAVVRNPEAFPVTLTSRRFQWGDAEREVSTPLEELPEPIVVPEGASVTLSVGVGFDVVPADVRSFAVLWLGHDDDGRIVHIESMFDVPLPDHRTLGARWGQVAVTRMLALGLKEVERAAQLEPEADPDPGVDVTERVERLGGRHAFGGLLGQLRGRGLHVERQGGAQVELPAGWGNIRVERAGAGGAGRRGRFQAAGHGVDEIDQLELRAGRDLTALNAVALPQKPIGASVTAVDSLSTLLENDDIATVLTRGRDGLDAGQGQGLGRISVAGSLLDLGGWAEVIKAGLSGPAEGRVCDPDNLPDDVDGEWACQVVPQADGNPEMVEWHRPARFVNARKGDLILAPGGPAGFIGGLLGQVTPPQRYAHIGIMTRNHDMITHCTFADERLKDHPNGAIDLGPLGSEPAPTDGFEPDVLRHGWPGTITQWVGGATESGRLADPAAVADPTSVTPGAEVAEVDATDPSGKAYKLAPFDRYPKISRSGESWQVVPPIVVKPNPALETAEVRQALHRLADGCRMDTGRTYYSFFGYTDARKSLTDTSTADGAWHNGRYPAVCSSFLWAVARRLNLQLEGPGGLARPQDLEPGDSPAVEVGDGTPDGLYVYRDDERTQAANWLHARVKTEVLENVKAKVRDKVGDLGRLNDLLAGVLNGLADMADDVANQMCNAFASDWCDTEAKDSDRWSAPGAGVAVSPDDTLRWDGPDVGGLYGYAVPAVYLPAIVERAPRYAWHFSPTKGTVHGVVRVDGAPRRGALVQVNDSAWGTTHTREDGSYRLPDVPFGRYELTAQFDRGDGAFYVEKRPIDLEQVDLGEDFGLVQPREANRLMAVTGSHYYMKYYTIGENPRTDPPYPYAFTRGVTPNPDSMRAEAYTASDFHGIFGVSSFLFNWLAGGSVQWAVNWSVCQDRALADRVAHALTDAVDELSFGFIPSMFGSEVKGQDMRTGVLAPGQVAEDSIRIGPGDRTAGLLRFRLENLQL